MKPKKLIIAAVSARPFVQAAARAGHEVVAFDAFADEDTRHAARRVCRLDYGRDGFDPVQFLQALREVCDFGADGLVYGSGFEATPLLLEEAGRLLPVIGNPPEVLRQLKKPRRFFGMLDTLGIAHPQIRYATPQTPGWLIKRGGGSGGTHILRWPAAVDMAEDTYYQREVAGDAVSVLFAAADGDIRVIGLNKQWTAPTPAMPYRYGGVSSHASLSPEAGRRLVAAARHIAVRAGLCGLNSLDAIVAGDEVLVLEVNPRLSATFELYCDADGRLFDLHLQACDGDLPQSPTTVQQARAQHIVYAPRQMQLPDSVQWPSWAGDLPAPGSTVAAGEPLCSVLGEAESAERARAVALEHERDVLAALGNG